MKHLLKFLVKEFGFLFEDYPLESGLLLIIICFGALYLLRNRIFYYEGESILKLIINLKTISYLIGIIGISQTLKGFKIYDSLMKDLINGVKVLVNDYPIYFGAFILLFGCFLIYDKLHPLNIIKNDNYYIIEEKGNYYELKSWIFIVIITLIGVSMVFRNL